MPTDTASLTSTVHSQPSYCTHQSGVDAYQGNPQRTLVKLLPSPRFCVYWQVFQPSLAWPSSSLSTCQQMLRPGVLQPGPSPISHCGYCILSQHSTAYIHSCISHNSRCCGLGSPAPPYIRTTYMPMNAIALSCLIGPEHWLLCSLWELLPASHRGQKVLQTCLA